MRYIGLNMAKAGMKLAYPIFDSNNRVLLGVQTILKEEHIRKLEERGFAGIYIEDELSQDIFIEESVPRELKNLGIKALQSQDIDAALQVSAKIAEQLMKNAEFSLDLVDLRSFDDYTYKHSVNVCVLSTVVGIGMGLSVKELLYLSAAALLHDIGKLQINPDILNKKDRLSQEEYTMVKQHSESAYHILRGKVEVAGEICQAVLYHHENEDGSGYPSGLKSEAIPMFSKIIHVVDVYDALTSRRPYKKPYAIAESIEYLMGGCGSFFDNQVVEVFMKAVPVYPKGTLVEVSDGRPALVVKNTNNPMRPQIRFEDGTDVDLNNDAAYRSITIAPTTEVELDFSDPTLETTQTDDSDDRKTILIVDDMVAILKSMQAIVEKEYRVVLAKSGVQAVKYLQNNAFPDLILMDIDMPEMNGIETVQKIHTEINAAIPIIFLTAIKDREVVVASSASKAKDYIVKPCKPLYMMERIHAALEGSRCAR